MKMMTMRAISTTPVTTPHTKAWLAFEQNLDSIGHMLNMGLNEIKVANAECTRLTAYLSKHRDFTNKATEKKLICSLNAMKKRFDRFNTANLWQVVMLVTCVEAYLQDLLSAAASVSPELMRESQQHAPYADVIAAKSLDELANELRARWARGWLSDGGPTRWLSRLKKMGARGYPKDLAPRLEQIWGIRHAVVHAAGVTNADFVKRHLGVVKTAGDRLCVSTRKYQAFIHAVTDLMNPTEQFFLSAYPLIIDK